MLFLLLQFLCGLWCTAAPATALIEPGCRWCVAPGITKIIVETRIVSLLPAATEIASALGLLDDVVGVSHECDFPREADTRPRVTPIRYTMPA